MRWDDGVCWHENQVTAPTEMPVTLAFVRDSHLRTPNATLEDAWITRAIAAATSQCEYETQRALMDQRWTLVLSRFPCRGIVLPRPPLIEVESIQYVDTDGTTQTLAEAAYRVIRKAGPKCRRSVIEPAYDTTWPATRCQLDAVTVTFRAGYVDDSVSPEESIVPEDLRQAIGMRAAEYYKQRSDSVMGPGMTLQRAIVASQSLFQDYRVY